MESIPMTGRYPEDSNIIDFIQYKLLHMAETYATQGQHDVADAIWNALDSYMSGDVDIIFKKGEPYVILNDNSLETSDEKNIQ